ncbi:bifunctional diguanylate cyclase/phosphodiesterase [Kushneria indalinina]|uniref:PAS domain S-box-containing protein/diguanylate cyclase (GGDEF)-like protein n=1 Tax=Kushneria indalinina DSM 14324 TaxID=1122140 RepID=A0A3D9DSR8_9GAMM|nr:EAL domain-containing protein [Kushneria indalinina]REC93787.1 PAS domain S-box-containing protein/diguanylate cyclase (GGDEF)-like protein [Kushneria indalinina DSM 14324]
MKQKFFSLKWRAIFLTSLVLLGLSSVFTFVSHLNMTRQFQVMQNNNYERQIKEIDVSIERDSNDLRQLASIVAASESLGDSLVSQNVAAGEEVLESQWPTLQLGSGLEEVTVFNTDGSVFLHMGQAQPDINDDIVARWIKNVGDNEIPENKVFCRQSCRQYAIVPILLDGESVGIVMVARPLADIALYTLQNAGGNIALVLNNDEKNTVDDHYLFDWSMTVTAITREQSTLALLKSAVNKFPFDDLLGDPRIIKHDDRFYELLAMPIEAEEESSKGYFILTSDVSDQISNINRTTSYTLLIALSGWLIAEILLFGIMWRPMARLRRLTYLLPVLAQGGFEKIRQHANTKNGLWHDEIDVLGQTTQKLANQLEILEGEVDLKGRQLNERLVELSHERDFITGLLNTAHVLIFTQDSDGRITLVNQYALEVLGMEKDQLVGQRFRDIFHHHARTLNHSTGQHESVVRGARHEEKIITWVHTAMGGNDRTAQRISVGLDISARKKAEQQLEWLAHRDPLTSLYNRRFFQQSLEAVIGRGAYGAVLYLDLDQFKMVNELGGHHAGDQLLRLVADALSSELAGECIVARQGGDEFSILLEAAGAQEAVGVAEKVHERLEGILFSEGGRHHRAMASIGIALYPEHGDNETDLMASADLAMYKAKEKSTQKWHLLSSIHESREQLQERAYWVELIRSSLAADRFMLMFQPIVRIDDFSVKHYEVLLRMQDENGTLHMPGAFIPVAERFGLIVEIDRWVVREAITLLSVFKDKQISLAINLSGQSLHDESIKHFLENEIKNNGVCPSRIIVEITETAAVADLAAARNVLQEISELGCQIALDDFGVGFSSFHYLDQLPSNYIKIDGSFVQNMLRDDKDRLIVKSIADIAHGFGKLVIAEFVDNKDMLSILDSYGVTYAQGYYLGRPERNIISDEVI